MTDQSLPSPTPKAASANEAPVSGRLKTQWSRLSSSRLGQGVKYAYTWRRPIFFGAGVGFFIGRYYYLKYQAAKRDLIHPDTYLIWRLYDGAIVEYPSNQTNLSMLLGSSGDGTEPPRVMTLHDVIRTLKFVQADDRITGLIADMSSTNAPSVSNDIPLGLAQIEEIQDALNELKAIKQDRLGPGKFKTAAFTETFRSQGEYAMASGFDEVYCQPSGEIPLVGINGTVTFYSKLLSWLGIKVHAEARTEYKSMVAPYTQEQFTQPQADNHMELLNDLNTNMLALIAANRFRSELPPDPAEADMMALTDRLKSYTKRGPIMAKEAMELGLISGTLYKEELLSKVMFGDEPVVSNELGETLQGSEKLDALRETIKMRKKGFYHYNKIMDRLAERKAKNEVLNVGVVYVLGTIGDVGEFGTGAIVKGLKEAGADDTIGTVVLRIDSGGGGVVESDTIWGAVKDLREKGKVVIASFGNAAASGGYLVATHADCIFASPSTITGSIGVASLRPTVTQSFFERCKITTQSFFTGSKSLSLYHELKGDELTRHRAHIDAAYEDFKHRVCDGRQISPQLIEKLAGGRVYTGLKIWELIDNMDQKISGTVDTPEKHISQTANVSDKNNPTKPEPMEPALLPVTEDFTPSLSNMVTHPASLLPSDAELLEEVTQYDIDLSAPQEQIIVDSSHSNGQLGRGIIDGIGGIRDAAVHGVETYLARLITQTREINPNKSQAEIMDEVLPGVPYASNEDGQVIMAFDIRLKKFPVHKSFWQQLSEASQRGDSIEGSGASLASLVKQSFANWMAQSVVHMIEGEMLDSLGVRKSDLSELRQLVRDIRHTNKSSIKAQMAPLRFQ